MVKLSVNINKIATLRNARGGNRPDVLQAALDCQSFGAEGITVHPRPDGRHIKYDDVRAIKDNISVEFNIEGNPVDSFRRLVLEVRPTQVTLVPDAPDALTSNAGWNTRENRGFLKDICGVFRSEGIRTSIFLNPDIEMVRYAAETGCDRIELYTESYAREYCDIPEKAVESYAKAALEAVNCGLGLNAGHDLNLDNLRFFKDNIPGLQEVSIGHALICDALYMGLEKSISAYLGELK